MELRELLEIIDRIERSPFGEAHIVYKGDTVHLKRGPARGEPPERGLPAPPPAPEEAAPAGAELRVVASPVSGVFYEAPEPGAPPFAGIDQPFERGQTLCVIESMKLMNEIEAPEDGVLAEVLAANGQRVEAGQPLFRYREP